MSTTSALAAASFAASTPPSMGSVSPHPSAYRTSRPSPARLRMPSSGVTAWEGSPL